MKFIFALIAILAYAEAAKIHPNILTSLTKNHGRKINIFISLENGSTIPVLEKLSQTFTKSWTKGDKATSVYQTLKAYSEESQKSTLEFLSRFEKSEEIKVISFWINNQIYVEGADRDLILKLANLPQVAGIVEEEIVQLDYENISESEDRQETEIEWGIKKVNADLAWEIPADGSYNTLVGIVDTGVRPTHEALKNNYIGGQYGWFDAYNKQGVAFDDNGHGTHVAGTICGTHGIGVSPKSKWAACKAFTSGGSGSQPNILLCGQFFACPHHPDGSNPDCTKAPNIVSNSWGSGASGLDWFDGVIAAWHAAEVVPVFSAGNSGPSCSTVRSPGDNRQVIAVGATAIDDTIASFSSVGPASAGHQKPEVSAPGANVRSAGHTSDTAYSVKSGTSMACPHVSGEIALLHSHKRTLKFEDYKKIIQDSASGANASQGKTCSGVPDNRIPNYHFGHGRIDVLKAVLSLNKYHS